MTVPESASATRSRIILGFAAVYVLWGSTYLAIRFAVATLPPLLMAGTRHLIAGLILYFLMRLLGGAPRPQPVHWRSALLLGGLFLLGGNGLVSWAEQSVPSGITALIVAVVPLWMVLLNAANERRRPLLSVLIGLALGIVGIGLLVLPNFTGAPGHGSAVGICVLLAATFSWAVGSLYAHQAPLPSSVLLGTAMEMLAGGALCWTAGLSIGEGAMLHLSVFTPRSLLSLAYLIVFGSLAGFSAYVWLLKVSTPARVSTYAFVNPVIAVLLGWLFAGEALSLRIMLAGAVIVAAVSLILYFGASHAPQTLQPPLTERPAATTSEERVA